MRPRTIRFHLLALIVVSVIPILVFAALVTVLFERQQRAALERSFRDTARSLSLVVDQELAASISSLRALSTSEHLEVDDLERFYAQAVRVLKTQPGWVTVIVYDRSGHQIVNALRPLGAAVPRSGAPDVVTRAFDTGQPAVSPLFMGAVLKAPIVVVTVPVIQGSAVKYVLGAGLKMGALTDLLSASKLPGDWLATILDQDGIIVARTRGIDQLLGRPAAPEFVRQSRGAEESSFRYVTTDGVSVYGAHSRSRLSGWTVGLGVPVAVVEAPGRASFLTLLGGGAALLLLAAGLSAQLGKRIASAIGALSVNARTLERGEPVPRARQSRILEVAAAERELAESARARVEAEETHRRSEASFRLLFASNPLPMWVFDLASLEFLEVNDAAIAHYGYSRDEFLRMRITDIRPSEDVARVEEAVAELVTRGDQAVRRGERTWRHRLKDGRIRDVGSAAHAIDFDGRRAMLVVAIDVTELKQTEASLATFTRRLEILHEIDRALIAAEAPAAIAEAALGRLRDLLGVPRAIVNLFDLEAGEAEWLAAAGRRRIHVGPGVRFSLALMGDVEALRRGELQVIDVTALPHSPEADALLASGVSTYMVIPMIAAGELIGGLSFGGAAAEFPPDQVSIAREVATQLAIAVAQARLHERVKRQAAELEERVEERTRELSAANAEADRANRAKSEFLSRMSHELRTPLNGIIGFSQLLQLDALSEEQRESVDHILKGGRHLLTLINEVLDIARIEADKLSISLEPVLASDVVRSALDLVRPQATARHVTLSETVARERYVLADRQRLQQVLLNLLSNAVKYNRDGGSVTVSCADAAAERVRMVVSDTGRGIAPAMLDRLFTPFDRLGAEEAGIEGTGLGLALSKRLVEAMGGALSVESEVGEGTTFVVELPHAENPAAPASTADEPRAHTAAPNTRGTVLYIEDNLANLRLFERIVARRPGLTLLSAMQGSRGLELARNHRPGVIILDLHLPDLPGSEVLARLGDDPKTRTIPVVILSADATPGQMARLLAQGARAYLTKPVDVSEVLTLLDELLDTRGA